MDIFKILILCIIVSLIALIFKNYKGEYAFLTILAGGTAVLIILLSLIAPVFEEIRLLFSVNGISSEYFKVAVKALGIAYISEYAADVCRDSGQTAMAAKAELAGRIFIFIISMPLLVSILNTALKFIGD